MSGFCAFSLYRNGFSVSPDMATAAVVNGEVSFDDWHGLVHLPECHFLTAKR